MSLQQLREKRNALVQAGEESTLEARVLGTFLGHPQMVGSPSEGCSRPLDMNQEYDRAMFLHSVLEKFEHLVATLGFQERERAAEFFIRYRLLIFRKDPPKPG